MQPMIVVQKEERRCMGELKASALHAGQLVICSDCGFIPTGFFARSV
jgi:hypothetical protein